MPTRREFLSNAAVLSAGATLGMSARSYAQIVGANERMQFAVIGLNGRANAHLESLRANQKDARITYVCDVDEVILNRFAARTEKVMGEPAKKEKDFRRMLESKDVDVITIATPEHWHTPMAIAGMQAGKHVYVEKPCSHNPHECELIVAAQKKYGKKVQMGNQQRSSAHTKEIVGKIHDGLIGRAYYALAWYRNARKSMGIGKVIPVPATLDWELWQGPAPRRPYKDNIHPYNWHWLKIYGTGEALNNGTHEVDVARWALDVKWPETIRSSGGRYAYKDDWQFPDTQQVEFLYPGDKQITWNSTSCNNASLNNRDRGTQIFGTTGSVIVDRDGYEVFDIKGKRVDGYHVPRKGKTSSADTIGADSMTDTHFKNLINAIRVGEKLDSPIDEASISVAILLMSNIAYDLKRELKLNTANGAFVNDPAATKMRTRTYQKGWEIRI
ncbi:MAG: Gfo/Idh/MocA family oxidoreductase [Acidobacteria bacterium]|nr:Gfo/Idh/MocA family oxidoreductase [Acidobacteriota bacterium]